MRERTGDSPGADSPPGRLDMEAFLTGLARESQPFLFIPNPGNAGDSLIAHATRQRFDRAGVPYRWAHDYRALDPRGRVVVYGGGGNLVPRYEDAARALRWANGRARRIVLLPHTVQGHEALLAELGPETDLICRERVSYEHVRRAVRAARCHLADDMAFGVDVDAAVSAPVPALSAWRNPIRRLLDRMRPGSARRGSRPRVRALRRAARAFAARGADATVLHAFRTDAERTGIPIPEDNLDLSALFDLGTGSPDASHLAARYLLRFVDRYELVRTDRLHVAIAAAVLGKRVEFHPNSYFKNRAVFEFSMRDRFPGVTWAGPGS